MGKSIKQGLVGKFLSVEAVVSLFWTHRVDRLEAIKLGWCELL